MTEVIVIGLIAFLWVLIVAVAFWIGLQLGKSLNEITPDELY